MPLPRLRMLLLLSLLATPALALDPLLATNNSTSKLVFLIIEDDNFIASDIRSSRFVELRRKAQEKVVDSSEAAQVVVIVTNQRIVAYSPLVQAWRGLRTQAGERLDSIKTEDFAALVITNQRLLSFNGAAGVWSERKR